MLIIMTLAIIFMFFLKPPKVAQSNTLRERTASVRILPGDNHLREELLSGDQSEAQYSSAENRIEDEIFDDD